MSVSLTDELMGCFPQMEELVGTRNSHPSNDFLLLLHCLPGSNSTHDNRKFLHFFNLLCEEDVETELHWRFYGTRFCCSPLSNLEASSYAAITIFSPESAAFI